MATEDELLRAFRRADEAGDTEAAKVIAERIVQLRSGGGQQPAFGGNAGRVQRTSEGRGYKLEDPSKGGGTLSLGPIDTGIPTPQWLDRSLAGLGKAQYGTARGIGQLVGLVSEEDEAESRRLDAPLMDTTAGFLGNVAGYGLQMIGPGVLAGGIAKGAQGANLMRAAQGANELRSLNAVANTANVVRSAALPTSLPGAVGQGAAIGYAQPVVQGESRGTNAAIGAGAGAVGYAIPGVIRGTRAAVWDPIFNQDRIVANTLRRFGGDDIRTTGAPNLPGYTPTLAEVSMNPGVARLQRAFQSNTGDAAANPLSDAFTSNNAARVRAVQGIAGDDSAMAAAEAARKRAAIPSLDKALGEQGVEVTRTARLIDRVLGGPAGQRDAIRPALERVKAQLFDPFPDAARVKAARKMVDDVLKTRTLPVKEAQALEEARRLLFNSAGNDPKSLEKALRGLTVKSKHGVQAIDAARHLLRAPNKKGKTDVARLYGVRQNIGDMMDKLKLDGVDATKMRELVVVKKSLDNAIAKAAPSFRNYLDTYTAMSRPIDQMKVARELLDGSTKGGFVQDSAQAASGVPTLQAGQYMAGLKNLDQTARRATGFKRASAEKIMTPEQVQTLRDVGDTLERYQFANVGGKAAGSETAAHLASANVMAELGPLGALGRTRPGQTVASVIDTLYKSVDVPNRLKARMAEVLANPAEASRILARVPREDRLLLERALSARAALITNQSAVAD